MPTSPTTRRPRRSHAAFTLVEMLLVLAVLGLVASLVVAKLDVRLPSYRLRLAGREIASTVSWVRTESIARAEPLAIRYDLDTGDYWVSLPDESGEIPEDPERERERFRRMSLPDGVGFADLSFFGGDPLTRGVVTVRFSFLGACEGHLIHLTDNDASAFTVEVLPLGAQVNLYNFRMESKDARVE